MNRCFTLLLALLLSLSFGLGAQTRAFTGVIFDAQTQEPLVGATVALEGTGRGTVTDAKG